MLRREPLPELLLLGLIALGFACSILAYRTFYPDNFDFLTSDEVVLGFLTCVGTFWFAVKLTRSDSVRNPWLRFIDELRIGTGINLIIQALLNYFDVLTRSLFLIVVGGVLAATLLMIGRRMMPSRREKLRAGTVMVGFDHPSAQLVPRLPYPLVEVVGGPSSPPGVPRAGYDEFETTVLREQPLQIVVAMDGSGRVNPTALLRQRLNGASVNSTPELYEELLGRVCCSGRQPVDLLLSPALSGNTQAMALQAIYTNLIGLVLLIAAFPLMGAAALAIGLFSGRGPILEAAECSGFRNIPFRRMRFRTRRGDGSGEFTRVGALIERLRLANLPLLFNIVRGEMALFGPSPVRRPFVARLSELMPFYSMRFAVKPGIISWGAVQAGAPLRVRTLTEIEYDLYYVKHGSPLLDLEILTRLMVGVKREKYAPVQFEPV